MSEEEVPIRRILVALDASSHSLTALETAAELAADFGAELQALFVEDVEVLRVADLPFTQEVRVLETSASATTSVTIQRQLRVQARRAWHSLESVTRSVEVEHSFRVVRGRVPTKILEAASEADLLLLGKASSSRSSRRKLGRTAQTVLAEARVPVMVLRHGVHPDTSVFVLYDESESSHKALQLAIQLAEHSVLSMLTVLLHAENDEEATARQQTLKEQLRERVSYARVRPLTSFEASRLSEVVWNEGGGLLIIPSSSAPAQGQRLQQLLYEMDYPVLLVR